MRAEVADTALWDALTTRPLGGLLRDGLGTDIARGIALTDGLIGTFSRADDPSLRQNRCFLDHVIGGGTGDWDVPVGGMGRVSGALENAARRASAEIRVNATVSAVAPDGSPCIEARTTTDLEGSLGMTAGDIFHGPLSWPWASDDAARIGGRALGRGDGARTGTAVRVGRASRRRRQRHRRAQRRDGGAGALD
jgi:phytoene dehydrogenase-like protein